MTKERELEVSMRCVKYMLFVANFMFALVGFLLISIGTTIKAIYTTLDHFVEEHYYSASDLAIAVGFIIFFVALFGCIGAFRESVCLINTYAFLLLCVLILELSISITTYVMRSYVRQTVYQKMNNTMAYYNTYTGKTWDVIQSNLECCGVNGPEDWAPYAAKFHLEKVIDQRNDTYRQNYTVPKTCCILDRCLITYSDYTLFRSGCYNRIVMVIAESALLLGIAALCVSFIQILGIIFALLLAKSVRKLKTQLLVERTEAQMKFYKQISVPKVKERSLAPVLYQPTSSEA